jgi:hypothetical protein
MAGVGVSIAFLFYGPFVVLFCSILGVILLLRGCFIFKSRPRVGKMLIILSVPCLGAVVGTLKCQFLGTCTDYIELFSFGGFLCGLLGGFLVSCLLTLLFGVQFLRKR